MIDKYIKIYHKRNVQVAFACATIVSVPLFVVSLFYDVVPEDTLVSFVPYILAAMCAAIAGLFTKRFRKMIHKQEQIYGVQFQDTDVVRLETTLYLSKDWLIRAGSCAMYKEHIKSISSAPRYGRVGSSNKVVIRSVDDKQYTIWCLSSSNVDRIKKWKNT
ncbi:MAG: hypothetical protein IKM61_04785 [Eubacteriaceae bacterium]|nr:hypothetical protein [Eubacteriaceae bacterium]